MSIATQVKRLQNVRNQIRTKMVALGLSKNTDLLQDLADDLDGVDKISPTNNGTTDPGTGYTNVDTLSRSTSTRYIKVPKGYNDADRKFTVSGVANGAYSASVASHTTTNATASSSVTGSVTGVATTTKPSGTDGTNYYTITPKLSTTAGSSKAIGKATIATAGYLAAGDKSSSESSKSVGVTATQGDTYYLKAGSYSASVASHTTSNATASSNVSGSIVNITSATKPSGTDGSDYFTITPTLTTSAGSSKATGKATVDAAGYLAAGNTTSTESSKSVGVTADQGDNYYLKASSVTKENPGVDPGNRYGNRATVNPSMEDQYVKITGGYLSDSKITIKKMTEGSVSSATTTDPGTENQTTVTPSLDKQYVKISAGHLPHSKITVEAIPNQKKSSDVSVGVSASISDITSIDTSQATSGVTVTASASGSVTVPLGYYSSAVTSTPTDSDSTTIKPVLAATATGSTTVPSTLPSGTVIITPNTDNTKRIYSDSTNKGFVTNIVLNAMDTSSVSSATTTDPGTDYTNKATVTPSTSAQYIKITKGYLPNSKITVSKMADGSISSATTTNPGDSYANRVTVTPSGTDAQYIKISKGYLPDGKITVNKMSAGSVASATTTNPGDSYANQTTVTPSGTDAQYVKISAGYLPNSKITINKMASGSVSSATTTDPGDSYTNQTTVTPSTSAQYVKVTAGYLPNSKITINKMADGSVSSATTTDPGDSYTNQTIVTPTKSKQYVKIFKGYLPNSKITINAIPKKTFNIASSAWSAMSPVNETGSYTCIISGVTGVKPDNDIVVLPSNTTAAATYGVYASAQGNSTITFKAFSKPPTMEYTVYILNS